jgi:hypothetical protein
MFCLIDMLVDHHFSLNLRPLHWHILRTATLDFSKFERIQPESSFNHPSREVRISHRNLGFNNLLFLWH